MPHLVLHHFCVLIVCSKPVVRMARNTRTSFPRFVLGMKKKISNSLVIFVTIPPSFRELVWVLLPQKCK